MMHRYKYDTTIEFQYEYIMIFNKNKGTNMLIKNIFFMYNLTKKIKLFDSRYKIKIKV